MYVFDYVLYGSKYAGDHCVHACVAPSFKSAFLSLLIFRLRL